MIPEGIRFRDGVLNGTDKPMRFALCKTSDGKQSCWGFDPATTTDDEAAALLADECKKNGIAILHDTYFIPGNRQRGMHCPKCGLNLDTGMCGYDPYGYLCHAGCL
jgi:hypothetical protein